jgi:nitroreductase
MDAIQAILTRRSIRRYTAEPVSDETVNELLKAAMSAPTAGNQPWHFVVLRDRTRLEAFPTFHPHSEMLRTAAVAILVCGDPNAGHLTGRWVLDCAAATENMLIAANSMGLGACWVGIYPLEERMDAVRNLLGVPGDLVPLSMVSLGHPGEEKPPPDRFRPDRIHYDTW